MGKNAKLKRLRRIAQHLPDCTKPKAVGQYNDGSLMFADRPVNHYNELKALYVKHGPEGPATYLRTIDEQMQAPETEKTQTP